MTSATFLQRTIGGSTPTSTGTVTYESPGFGTPVGGVIIGSLGTSINTLEDGACWTFGTFDGTRERVTFGYDRDNLGTQDSASGGDEDAGIFRLYDNSGTIIVEGEWSAWSTNGVTIDWTVVDTVAHEFGIALIGGTEAEAYAFHASAPIAGVTVTPGFATSFVLTNYAATIDGSLANEMRWGPGIASDATGSDLNGMGGCYSDDGVGTTETHRRASSIDLGQGYRIQPGPDLASGTAVIGDYTSTEFVVKAGGIGVGPRIMGLAVYVGSEADVHIDTDDPSPASTGTQDKTASGHKSGFVYMVSSASDNVNGFQTAGAAGVGFSDFQNERYVGVHSQNNQGTSNSSSLTSDKFIDLYNHSGATQLCEAIASAKLSTGFEMDWTTISASARRIKYVSIQEVAQVLEPGGIASGESFGQPTLAPGAVTVEPGGIASEEAVGTPTVLPGTVTIGGAFGIAAIPSEEAFGTPTLVATVTLQPGGIASGEAFGSPTLVAGAVTVEPGGIASAEAFGQPTLDVEVTLEPGGVASGEALGQPTLVAGAVTIEVGGIASGETFGQPTLVTGATISPGGIASGELFGQPTLIVGVVILAPGAIPSGELFGQPTLVPGAVTLTPTGIATGEALGTPTLDPLDVNVRPDGISSSEALGLPTMVAGQVFIAPTGISSEEAFGIPELVIPGVQTIILAGIPSAEAFGTPGLIQPGIEQTIILTGIPSMETLGIPFLAGGFIPVTLKKKIHDALIALAKGGTFVAAGYDGDSCTLEQGLQVPPESVLANEVLSAYARESRHGRSLRDDRTAWRWELRLRFGEEVITEIFEEAFLATPIVVPRDLSDPASRQAIVSLLDARYEHPPQQGASNGTEVVFTVNADVCPA